jgi:antirestriction protein ArdC
MKGKKKTSNADNKLNQQVADKLISVVKEGNFGKWVKTWYESSAFSLAKNDFYVGGNAMWLSEEVQGKTAIYGTFNHFKEKGFSVKKGAKATYSYLAKKMPFSKKDEETGETTLEYYFGYRVFPVFSIDDLDISEEDYAKLSAKGKQPKNDNKPLLDKGTVEKMLEATGATLSRGANPYYVPATHTVVVPDITKFTDSRSYYEALFHELSHATSKNLNRKLSGWSTENAKGYAFEELIAEMSSAMLCAHFGIEKDESNTASYLDSWSKHLDGKAMFSAVGKAMESANLILANTKEMIKEVAA